MRIVGGSHRGTHLAPLGAGDEAARLRPTSDRVREAIFNLLLNGRLDGGADPVTGARVLDLFAGTGALGLEALSRGATHATLVDSGTVAGALQKANVERLRLQGQAARLKADATRLPQNPGAPFTLLFLDPPYGKGLGEAALAQARAQGWIAPGALIVWEEGRPPAPPPGYAPVDQRRYGDTTVTILRQKDGGQPGPPA